MKPGQRTTEFLVTASVIIGAVATALEGSLSPKWAAVAASIAAGAYAISRGIAKNGTPGA